MKTRFFKVELNEYQYARLGAVAKERGLTPDETIRLMVVMSINHRYRDLQVEELRVAYFKRMANLEREHAMTDEEPIERTRTELER